MKRKHAQQFHEIFNTLCHTRSSGQVWGDFVLMSACSISNAADMTMYEQRERLYMQTVRNFKRDEVYKIKQLFDLIVDALERETEQDFLGDIYSELGLCSVRKAQYFTPYIIAKMKAQLLFGDLAETIKEKGFASVNEPACGSGVMLIAAANVALAQGINYQQSVVFVAQDIDFTAAMMAYIQLSLLGCVGFVGVGNTLTDPNPSRENIWNMPMNLLRRNLLEAFYH